MRGDLDFLYHKAMRSLDWVFIDEVAALLGTNGRNDDANILYQRSEKIWVTIHVSPEKKSGER